VGERRSGKHIVYYDLLDAVREAAGCFLCAIEANSIRRYYESLVHECVNDPGVREALLRSQGYCHRHAHYLRSRRSAPAIAILYEDQVKLFLSLLDRLRSASPNSLRTTAHVRRRREVCPACRVQNDCRNRYCSALIEWFHDPEMRAALDQCRGLCVPHFLALLDKPMDSQTRWCLIEMQRARMVSLLGELAEFRRKQDYRFSGEELGSESDSWLRAVSMMVGEEGIF